MRNVPPLTEQQPVIPSEVVDDGREGSVRSGPSSQRGGQRQRQWRARNGPPPAPARTTGYNCQCQPNLKSCVISETHPPRGRSMLATTPTKRRRFRGQGRRPTCATQELADKARTPLSTRSTTNSMGGEPTPGYSTIVAWRRRMFATTSSVKACGYWKKKKCYQTFADLLHANQHNNRPAVASQNPPPTEDLKAKGDEDGWEFWARVYDDPKLREQAAVATNEVRQSSSNR